MKRSATTYVSNTTSASGKVNRSSIGHAEQSLRIAAIAKEFESAKSEADAQAAAFRAIAFYTKNSSRINAPLRKGEGSKILDTFRRTVDYGLERLEDYGQPRGQLDRRVHFSREMIDAIIRDGSLYDPAFISTSAHNLDPNAATLRNTLIHIIDAKYAADVSSISPDPHARENLLRSHSTLDLIKAKVAPVVDKDDPLFNPKDDSRVRAELWMRQKTPEPEQR
jgi:hypothetical protein